MKPDQSGSTRNEQGSASLLSWAIVLGIASTFFVWGIFIFFTVGDKGSPPWNFGVVADIPGESPYADYGPQFVPGKGMVVPPQHVREGPPESFGPQQGVNK